MPRADANYLIRQVKSEVERVRSSMSDEEYIQACRTLARHFNDLVLEYVEDEDE